MFPNFTSLSQRERQRQELLREVERDLAIDRHLRQKFAEALWAADNETSTISVLPSTTATSTQTSVGTDPTPTSQGVFSGNEVPLMASDISQGALSTSAISDTPSTNAPMSVGSVEDDASTAQQSALHEVKRLITEHPSFLVDPISPTLLITSKWKGNTYFIGADAVLYKMNDRSRVRPQLQSTLNDEIDWVETYNHMASVLDSKKESSARARLPSTDDEKRAALEKLYQSNIKRSQSEALAQLDNNRKAALAQWGPPKRELDDSAVSDIDRSPKRPNLMLMSRSKSPSVAMIESKGDSKRQLKNIYARNPWLVRYYLPPTVVKNKERIQLTNY